MPDKSKRLPVPPAALPDFAPVPRQCPRHDGWTVERQRAFVGALADTGCVKIAARMVNMTPESAYQLRRAPGAEGFRKAWEAAQGLGLQAVKDEAFHRAMHGQLVPVFVAGKLMGFRRKKNDRLLMFILRHYGEDANGRRTTINYFSTRATAGAAAPSGRRELRSSAPTSARDAGSGRPTTGEAVSIDVMDTLHDDGSALTAAAPTPALAAAEASTTTVKTVISGARAGPRPTDDEAAALLDSFAAVDLDDQAKADIYRALEAAAERRRALAAAPAEDPDLWYVGDREAGPFAGELELGVEHDDDVFRAEGEHRWESLGEGGNAAEIDRVLAGMAARAAARSDDDRAAEAAAARAAIAADRERQQKVPLRLSRTQPGGDVAADDPERDWENWTTGDDVAPATPLPLAGGEKGVGTNTSRRPYRKRQPKPPFTPLAPGEAGPAYDTRKAQAIAETTSARRSDAAATAARRRRRKAAPG